MSYSSVYFHRRKNLIHYWEYENGEKVHKTAPAPLYFYVNDDNGEYKTISGNSAKRVECSNWNDFKDKREKYKRMGFTLYESDIPIETKFIVNEYLGQDLSIPKNFDIHYYDIEVHSDEGFPRPENADYPVVIITIWSTKHNKFFIFAEKDFDDSFIEEEHEKFVFSDEESLLKSFIKWTCNESPDVLTGWNCNGFDTPYLINRTTKLLGEKWVKRLSPLGIVRAREYHVSETKMETRYDIAGIACLDMLEIYKNYTFSDRENYRLGYITSVELGADITKNEYEGSIADFYHNDWQGYVEYNIQDTRLLRQLEDKLGYIKMLINFCYGCRVPFEHYNKTTRVLDGAFVSELTREGVVLNDVNRSISDVSYPGGLVMEPDRGVHDWVVSYDATSLYPSIMMGWNISPETKIAVFNLSKVRNIYNCYMGEDFYQDTVVWDGKTLDLKDFCGLIDKEIGLKNVNDLGGFHRLANEQAVDNVMKCLSGKKYENVSFHWNEEEIDARTAADRIQKENLVLAYNGVIYDQKQQGVIPRFVEEWFNRRKKFKNKMIESEKMSEKYGKSGDEEKKKKYDGDAKYYNLLQLNYKILINSVYGYLGTVHSRFYDFDNAVAVTRTGQLITKTVAESVNGFFSKKWSSSKMGKKVNAKDIERSVIYGDTDSCPGYVKVGNHLSETISELFTRMKNDNTNRIENSEDGREFVFVNNDETLLFYDEKDKCIKNGKIDYLYRHKVSKNIFRIKTKSGKFVDLTEDHTCIVLDEFGNTKEVKPREIQKGDKVITLKRSK